MTRSGRCSSRPSARADTGARSSERFAEALDDFDRALAIAAPARVLVERERAAQALAHSAWVLRQLGHDDEAVEAYEALVERYGADAHPAFRRLVSSALVSAGIVLEQRGSYGRAVEKYEQVFARFRDDPDPEVRARAARGLYYNGLRLARTGERSTAREVFEQVVALYGAEAPGSPTERSTGRGKGRVVSRRAGAARAGATRRSRRSAARARRPRRPRRRA